MRNVAVVDIGKTNVKLALVQEGCLQELAVVTKANTPRAGPPYRHFDLAGHWNFFLHHLAAFHAQLGVDAISVTTHGASAVLLDAADQLACPMLDYEDPSPTSLAASYDALRPSFAESGSSRLPLGLNLGAQLHWLLSAQNEFSGLSRHLSRIVTYPQYWGFLLTGEAACDLCSLGCHTDLWNPRQGDFSPLVERLGLTGRIASPRRPDETLGNLRPALAAATGLSPKTPVSVGIHDSNASLYPHLVCRQGPFSVVSTGTWVICMAIDGDNRQLDPSRDTLVNVDALGRPVASARFMGGREFERLSEGHTGPITQADRAAVLARKMAVLPAVEANSGPFPGHRMRWTAQPESVGQRLVAVSFYLALMTRTCLDLIGTRGPVIVEGPFARNSHYLAMLSSLSPEGVEAATSVTGTSVGAALLCLGAARAPDTQPVPRPIDAADLCAFAKTWRSLVVREEFDFRSSLGVF